VGRRVPPRESEEGALQCPPPVVCLRPERCVCRAVAWAWAHAFNCSQRQVQASLIALPPPLLPHAQPQTVSLTTGGVIDPLLNTITELQSAACNGIKTVRSTTTQTTGTVSKLPSHGVASGAPSSCQPLCRPPDPQPPAPPHAALQLGPALRVLLHRADQRGLHPGGRVHVRTAWMPQGASAPSFLMPMRASHSAPTPYVSQHAHGQPAST
jgi:hypothetical protein